MRILLIPRIDTIDGTCSLSRLPLGFVRESLNTHDDAFFYIVVHEKFSEDKEWLRNYGITHLDRIEFVPLDDEDVGSPDKVTYQRRLEYTVGPSLRSKIRPWDAPGRYADVVITECFQSSHYIRSIMNGFYLRSYTPTIPIICWAHWNPTSEWVRLGKSGILNKNDWQASVNGLIGSDGVVFGSVVQRDQTLEDLHKWFNAKTITKFREEWPVIEAGVEVDTIPFEESREGPLVGVWSGYTSQDFQPCATSLVRAGMTKKIGKVILQFMGVKIGTKRPEEVEKYEKLEYVDIAPLMSHEDFVGLLSTCDFMTSTVAHSWGIRVAEAMAAGCVPITTQLTCKNMRLPDEYPFRVKPPMPESAVPALSKFLSDNKVRNKWRKYVRDYAVENFDIKKQSDKIYQYAKSLLDKNIEEFEPGDLLNKVKSAIEGSDQLAHVEIVNRVGDRATSGHGGYFSDTSEGLFAHRFLRYVMFRLNYRDMGNGEGSPIYTRSK